MTHPDHRHIPFPLDKITGITTALFVKTACGRWLGGAEGRIRAARAALSREAYVRR